MKVNSIIDYLKAFINSMSIEIERGHIRKGYWDKTVCINTGGLGSLEFDVSSAQKEDLIAEGYNSTKNYFYCKINNLINYNNEIF